MNLFLNHVFLCNTRLSRQAHSYVVDWPVDRTILCGQNLLFSRIIRMWNYIGAEKSSQAFANNLNI